MGMTGRVLFGGSWWSGRGSVDARIPPAPAFQGNSPSLSLSLLANPLSLFILPPTLLPGHSASPYRFFLPNDAKAGTAADCLTHDKVHDTYYTHARGQEGSPIGGVD